MVWAILIGGAGYLFGAAFTGMLTHAKHYEAIAFAVLGVVAFAVTWLMKVLHRTPRTVTPRPHTEVEPD